MLFYVLVASDCTHVIDFFVTREDAEAALRDVLNDEPDFADILTIEELELGGPLCLSEVRFSFQLLLNDCFACYDGSRLNYTCDGQSGTLPFSRRMVVEPTARVSLFMKCTICGSKDHEARSESRNSWQEEEKRGSYSEPFFIGLSKAFGMTTDFILTGQESVEPDLVGAIRASAQLTTERKRNLIALVKDLLH